MAQLEKNVVEPKNKIAKRILIVVCILLALVSVASASYYWFYKTTPKPVTDNKAPVDIVTPQNKMNIMVMGIDERGDDVGRSDTLFVMTIDTNTKEVAMLSIPRDTRVKIPGNGWDKINHAYAFGGEKLSQEAVEGLLGIKIDRRVLINIAGFKKIIDAIGGITVDVEKRMSYNDPYDDNGGLVIDLQPGRQHMDGDTAIQYVRYRDEEGDIGRVERQQKFLKAFLNEVASPSIITKVPAMIREISSVIKTDMSTSEMLNIAKMLNDASKKGLKTDMVPGKAAYIDEVSYWLPDLMALRKHIAQTLGVEIEGKYVAVTQREATEYETSLPKEMKIIEKPKSTETSKVAIDSTKDKEKEKEKEKNKEKEKEKTTTINNGSDSNKPVPKPTNTGKVRVEVINASGVADAGDKIAGMLRGQGFEVTGVSGVSTPYKSTVVISNTTEEDVVGKLNGLPFKYSLQVTNDPAKTTDAVVVIGKDYSGK